MKLQAILGVVALLPEIVTDIEGEVATFKQGPDAAAKIQAAVTGIEKLVGDVLPLLKSGV